MAIRTTEFMCLNASHFVFYEGYFERRRVCAKVLRGGVKQFVQRGVLRPCLPGPELPASSPACCGQLRSKLRKGTLEKRQMAASLEFDEF